MNNNFLEKSINSNIKSKELIYNKNEDNNTNKDNNTINNTNVIITENKDNNTINTDLITQRTNENFDENIFNKYKEINNVSIDIDNNNNAHDKNNKNCDNIINNNLDIIDDFDIKINDEYLLDLKDNSKLKSDIFYNDINESLDEKNISTGKEFDTITIKEIENKIENKIENIINSSTVPDLV